MLLIRYGGRDATNENDVYFTFNNVFDFTFKCNASKILKKDRKGDAI